MLIFVFTLTVTQTTGSSVLCRAHVFHLDILKFTRKVDNSHIWTVCICSASSGLLHTMSAGRCYDLNASIWNWLLSSSSEYFPLISTSCPHFCCFETLLPLEVVSLLFTCVTLDQVSDLSDWKYIPMKLFSFTESVFWLVNKIWMPFTSSNKPLCWWDVYVIFNTSVQNFAIENIASLVFQSSGRIST